MINSAASAPTAMPPMRVRRTTSLRRPSRRGAGWMASQVRWSSSTELADVFATFVVVCAKSISPRATARPRPHALGLPFTKKPRRFRRGFVQ
jgi:hypothetical protein